MFIKEGWASPASFHRRFFYIESRLLASECEANACSAQQMADCALSRMLQNAKYGGILMPNGHVVGVDDGFLSRVVSRSPFRHAYFNLLTGEVGKTDGSFLASLHDANRWVLPIQKLFLSSRGWPLTLLYATIAAFIFATCYMGIMSSITGMGFFDVLPPKPSILSIIIVYAFMFLLLPLAHLRLQRRKAERSCKAYAGGHLIIPEQVFDEFCSYYYATPESIDLVSQGTEADQDTPSGIAAAYESFKAVCPDGKGASGMTWEQIEAKTGYSRRHINRAIEQMSSEQRGQ